MLSIYRGIVTRTETKPTVEGSQFIATVKDMKGREKDFPCRVDVFPGHAGIVVIGDEEIIWLER